MYYSDFQGKRTCREILSLVFCFPQRLSLLYVLAFKFTVFLYKSESLKSRTDAMLFLVSVVFSVVAAVLTVFTFIAFSPCSQTLIVETRALTAGERVCVAAGCITAVKPPCLTGDACSWRRCRRPTHSVSKRKLLSVLSHRSVTVASLWLLFTHSLQWQLQLYKSIYFTWMDFIKSSCSRWS